MDLKIEHILEENEKGSNLFIEALKRGNENKLILYFNIAKENNINLFDYAGRTESPLDAIIKLVSKNIKDKDLTSCLEYLDGLFTYLNKNGFKLYQDKFINEKIEFPYISRYNNYILKINGSNFNISDYILKFCAENENISQIKNPEEMVNKTSDNLLGKPEYKKFIKRLYKSNAFYNILTIEPRLLTKIGTGKDKAFSITEEIIKELNKKTYNKNLFDYIVFEMTSKGNHSFLINLVKKDEGIANELKKIVLSDDKFNMNMNIRTKIKEEFDNVDQYLFLKEDKPQEFWNFLDKIIAFNEEYPKYKITLKEEMKNPDNYLKLLSYFTYNRFTISHPRWINSSDIEEKLKNINMICKKDLFPSLFKNKSGVHGFENLHYSMKEYVYLLKDWISKEDIQRNAGSLKIEEIEECKKRNMSGEYYDKEQVFSKILFLLQKNPECICDLIDNQKMSIKQSLFRLDGNLYDKYFKSDNFGIEKYLNQRKIKDDYSINKDELKASLVEYFNKKKENITDNNLKIKIDYFCENFISLSQKNPELFISKTEEIVLLLKINNSDNTIKPKKRL